MPGSGGNTNPNAAYTQATVGQAILRGSGVEPTPAAMALLSAWMRAEGGHWKNSARYNPLNTTMERGGSKSINSHGVKAYANWNDGIAANVATLKLPAYAGILAALKAGDKNGFVNAVVKSPWGTPREPLNSIVQEADTDGFQVGDLNPVPSITEGIQGYISTATNFIREAGIVAGIFALAILLLILGIVVIALGSSSGRKALSAGAAATPVGRGAKIAKGGAASRALSTATIAEREAVKTSAAVERVKALAEAKASAPKKTSAPKGFRTRRTRYISNGYAGNTVPYE